MASLAVATLCAGCGEGEPFFAPQNQMDGVLGHSTFTYGCAADTDPQCNPRSEIAPRAETSKFPVIALGSRFRVGSSDDVRLESDGLIIDLDSGYCAAVSEGWTTVSTTRGSSEVYDLAYLRVTAPKGIRVLQSTSTTTNDFESGTITIGLGGVSGEVVVSKQQHFRFRAYVVDEDEALLAGAFPIRWTVADPTILAFDHPEDADASNIIELSGKRAGTTSVTVELAGFSSTFNVEVGS